MTGTAPDRHVELEGCCNFRDLGGYPAAGGRRTRWRLLFRADGLSTLSDADLTVVAELRIRNVIDLRTSLEVEARGRFPDHDAIRYHHLPLTDTLPGAEDVPAWDDAGFVARRYASYLDGEAPSVGAVLRLLAEPSNLPAVFHCSVGKDRTGVLAALVLGFLGVPDEVIVEDYTLSARAMMQILERLRAEYPDSQEVVARFAPVILSVSPEAIAGFLSRDARPLRVMGGHGPGARAGADGGAPAPGAARARLSLAADRAPGAAPGRRLSGSARRFSPSPRRRDGRATSRAVMFSLHLLHPAGPGDDRRDVGVLGAPGDGQLGQRAVQLVGHRLQRAAPSRCAWGR